MVGLKKFNPTQPTWVGLGWTIFLFIIIIKLSIKKYITPATWVNKQNIKKGPDKDKLAKQDREKGTQQVDKRKYCRVRNRPVSWDKAKTFKNQPKEN